MTFKFKKFVCKLNTFNFFLMDYSFVFRLTEEQLEGQIIPLKFVKFQNVQNLMFFFKDNQGGDEVTQIDHLSIIGTPIQSTNMDDFKRVSGKKGEAHA